MIEVCNCADPNSGSNLGGHGEDCDSGMGVTRNIILMTRDKQDATTNGIDITTDVLNPAFFDGKFRDSNFPDRWLFSSLVDGIDNPVVDDNIETTPAGNIKFLSKGIRQVTLPFYTSDPYKLAAQFLSNACRGNLAFFEVDDEGNTQGELVGDIFNGRRIQKQSFRANPVIPTDASSSRVDVIFNIARRSKDTLVDYLLGSSMGGYVMEDTQPLTDVEISNMAGVVAQIEFDLKQIVGGVKSRFPATGLDETHLEIFNVTDDAVEPIASLTETTDGHYVAVYTAPVTIADVIEVRGIGEVYVQLSYDLKRLIGVTTITA